MRFSFGHRRREAPSPPASAQPPSEPLPPPAALPAPERPEPPSDDEILAYLDSSLSRPARHVPRPAQLDLMERVFELASRDWTEEEAGAELAWLAQYDRPMLETLYQRLVAGLIRNPLPDIVGVRASRAAFSALQYCATSTGCRAARGHDLRY